MENCSHTPCISAYILSYLGRGGVTEETRSFWDPQKKFSFILYKKNKTNKKNFEKNFNGLKNPQNMHFSIYILLTLLIIDESILYFFIVQDCRLDRFRTRRVCDIRLSEFSHNLHKWYGMDNFILLLFGIQLFVYSWNQNGFCTEKTKFHIHFWSDFEFIS